MKFDKTKKAYAFVTALNAAKTQYRVRTLADSAVCVEWHGERPYSVFFEFDFGTHTWVPDFSLCHALSWQDRRWFAHILLAAAKHNVKLNRRMLAA